MSIRYDAASDTFWIPKSDRLQEAQLDADYERIPGELRWRNKKPTFMQKIASFAQAVTSGIASDEVIALREKSCFGGENEPACPVLVVDGGNKYCGACGCGKWLLSSLSEGIAPKLRWEFLNCPLRRPGFSNSL